MMESLDLAGRVLVVFDGHCGLCNRSVRWFLVRDRFDRMRFVDSDSPLVAGLPARQGIPFADAAPGPSSILVVRGAGTRDERVLVRSDAVLALLRELPGPWPAVAAALGGIPRPLRDLAYRLIARWRYRIWGRLESCPIPTAEERARFL
jgi:predicted DCC family thiol-disulfide oxidoreductase YuxK